MAGQEGSERDAVPRRDAESRVGCALVDVEASADGHHDRQQAQREGYAQRGENARAPVAKDIIADELGRASWIGERICQCRNDALHRLYGPAATRGRDAAGVCTSHAQEMFVAPEAAP